MLKNAHLLRSPHPSSLRRTCEYASLLRISGALHLSIFEHPGDKPLFQRAAKSQLHAFTGHGGGFRTVSLRKSQNKSPKFVGAEVTVPSVNDRRNFGT
jgi:hypothetical protein